MHQPEESAILEKKGKSRTSSAVYSLQGTEGYLVNLQNHSITDSISIVQGAYSELSSTMISNSKSSSTQIYSTLLSFNTDLTDSQDIQERTKNDNYLTMEQDHQLDNNYESKKQSNLFLVTHSQQDTVEVKTTDDRLVATYIGKGRASMDVGNVRSNSPWKYIKRIHYFEVTMDATVQRGNIYIGLSDSKFSWSKNLGFFANSFAYRSEDGKKIHERGIQESYGPSFSQGHVIGCGFDTCLQNIFYTLDGEYLGIAFSNVPLLDYYPTATMHAFGETIRFNFCHPFKFDIFSFEKEQTLLLKESIISSPNMDNHTIIVQYLLFYGYEDTLKALKAPLSVYSTNQEWKSLSSTLSSRSAIRKSILRGDIHNAIQLAGQYLCPNICIDDYSSNIPHQIWFPLKCQEWIEIIKRGNEEEIFSFLKNDFGPFRPLGSEESDFLEACITLVAYEEPSTCPWNWLLDQEQRDRIADIVNVYLVLFGLCSHSKDAVFSSLIYQVSTLELALRQLIQSLRVLQQSYRKSKGSIFYALSTGMLDEDSNEEEKKQLDANSSGIEPFVKLLCSL